MAKRKTNKVSVSKGTLWKAGTDKGFNTLNDAIDTVFKCCGPDCCENVYRWEDHDTKETFVTYFKSGVFVFQSEKDFKEGVAPTPV